MQTSEFSIKQQYPKRSEFYDAFNAPLNVDVLMFIQIMRDSVFPSCAVAGSAALHQILYEVDPQKTTPKIRKLCSLSDHNDVDVFVPRYPYLQRRQNGESVADEHLKREFLEVFLDGTVELFENFHTTSRSKVRCRHIEEPYYSNHNYSFLSLWPGISDVIEVQLKKQNAVHKIQITVVDRIVDGDWEEIIPKAFDINVVKLKVRIDHRNFYRPTVFFVDPSARQSLIDASFDYVVSPAQDFHQSRLRIEKYLNRGFTIRSLTFDRRIPHLWREHWLSQARIHFSKHWVEQMFKPSAQNKMSREDTGWKSCDFNFRHHSSKQQKQKTENNLLAWLETSNETKRLNKVIDRPVKEIAEKLGLICNLVVPFLPSMSHQYAIKLKTWQFDEERRRQDPINTAMHCFRQPLANIRGHRLIATIWESAVTRDQRHQQHQGEVHSDSDA